MIKHGEAPFLECSTAGDKRFSAFCARIEGRNAQTIEKIYQQAKVFADGSTKVDIWQAKGRVPTNQEEVTQLYEQLWKEYLAENPDLILPLLQARGLSDQFGQKGHVCQATVLWKARNLYYTLGCTVRLTCNILDDGGDGHHPRGYFAFKDDLAVVVKDAQETGMLQINPVGSKDMIISVYLDEVEPV